mgnify:CR=1 FL=1
MLELAKKLAQLGFDVDIWTRRFEDQPAMDIVNERVRVQDYVVAVRFFSGLLKGLDGLQER